MIIYEGPSRLDRKPIVVIAVGIDQPSHNPKTGSVVQTYILRSDMAPGTAVKNGHDFSICGDCPRRGVADGKHANGRDCYVHIPRGPAQVWRAFSEGRYRAAPEEAWVGAGQHVRIGTYGDPAAVPIKVWERLTFLSIGWTGYTHQWRRLPLSWAHYVMASVDTAEEAIIAQAKGWRTYRVKWPDQDVEKGEVVCPASHEMRRRTNCARCQMCGGLSITAPNIVIDLHGTNVRYYLRQRAAGG